MWTGKPSYWGNGKRFKALIFMPGLVSARFYGTTCMCTLNGSELQQREMILLYVHVSGADVQ